MLASDSQSQCLRLKEGDYVSRYPQPKGPRARGGTESGPQEVNTAGVKMRPPAGGEESRGHGEGQEPSCSPQVGAADYRAEFQGPGKVAQRSGQSYSPAKTGASV